MDLHVKFDGHEIIVTRPGTDMMTAYRKAPDKPNLILTRSWVQPTVTSPEISEFRAPTPFRPRSPRRVSRVDCVTKNIDINSTQARANGGNSSKAKPQRPFYLCWHGGVKASPHCPTTIGVSNDHESTSYRRCFGGPFNPSPRKGGGRTG